MRKQAIAAAVLAAAAGCGARQPRGANIGGDRAALALSRVTLYQNGVGYFERSGRIAENRVRLAFPRGFLDDALKTLTVIDRMGSAVARVDVGGDAKTAALDVRLAPAPAHDLQVSYAVPQPAWRPAYRVVLDDGGRALLQAWAMVHNETEDDWRGVRLTLATGAPMSFAVDMHTPEFVQRPDATGTLRMPSLLGPVGDEHATAAAVADRDGDGVPDDVDGCPDDDGPTVPSNLDDGCPERGARGRVVVTGASVSVLEAVAFGPGSAAVAPASGPTLDAVAATMAAAPDVQLVEIGGSASADEPDGWALSLRRAEAVRDELVKRGVASSRLRPQPYGATQPRDAKDPARNRRVEFVILKRGDGAGGEASANGMHVDVAGAMHAARARVAPAAVAGTVRYAIGEPLDLARGASAMVAIVNAPIAAEEVELWRPDANAPGSDTHPFRAVRLRNTSGYTLEPGPIALFARGTFVGDTLLGRVGAGETAWVPFAVDGATQVASEVAGAEKPLRIARIAKGVMTVELANERSTTYRVAAGADPAKLLVIRHAVAPGFAVDASALPPGSVDRGDGSVMIALPIAGGKASAVTIVERAPRTREVSVVDARADELAAYVAGSALPADVAARLEAAVAARGAVAAKAAEVAALRDEIAAVSGRAADARETLATIDKVRGADALRARLLATLTAASADADARARRLAIAMAELAAARAALADELAHLTL